MKFTVLLQLLLEECGEFYLSCYRAEAIILGEALVEGGFLECVTDDGFSDNCSLYRLVRVQNEDTSLITSTSDDHTDQTSVGQEGQEPSWVKEVPHRMYDSNTTTGTLSQIFLKQLFVSFLFVKFEIRL